jgi:TM2 domain-containing membrane protein YozV
MIIQEVAMTSAIRASLSEPAMTATKYCSGCGVAIHKEAQACPKCGFPQRDIATKERKSRGLAVVLALLLGGIGIHKFYLGRIGWGVVYLLFCWTFVPSVIALIEALVYAFMGEHSFHEKYG